MSCPACGGTDRRARAPGLFECTSRVAAGAAPDPRAPHLPWVPLERTCGTQFQESPPAAGGAMPMCDCGTFAVGQCQTCQRPVCGLCSRIVDGKRQCQTCGQARARAREQQAQEAAQAAAQAQATQLAAMSPTDYLVAVLRDAARAGSMAGVPCTRPATGAQIFAAVSQALGASNRGDGCWRFGPGPAGDTRELRPDGSVTDVPGVRKTWLGGTAPIPRTVLSDSQQAHPASDVAAMLHAFVDTVRQVETARRINDF